MIKPIASRQLTSHSANINQIAIVVNWDVNTHHFTRGSVSLRETDRN